MPAPGPSGSWHVGSFNYTIGLSYGIRYYLDYTAEPIGFGTYSYSMYRYSYLAVYNGVNVAGSGYVAATSFPYGLFPVLSTVSSSKRYEQGDLADGTWDDSGITYVGGIYRKVMTFYIAESNFY